VYSALCYKISLHTDIVLDYICNSEAYFRLFVKKVPYVVLWYASAKKHINFELNWKERGNWFMICMMQSKNCRKIGDF
jgi:hypothetical protein